MPKLTQTLPAYRRHRASGQAFVKLAGRCHYLGKFNSAGSKREYQRLLGEWLAAGRPARLVEPSRGPSVAEIILKYWAHAREYYTDASGKPTGEQANIRATLKLLRKTYADAPAESFGPLSLTAIQQTLIAQGLSRRYINAVSGRIRRMFRWAVSRELVPPAVHQGLSALPGLRVGRTAAREPAPIAPVSAADVDATLPFLPPVVCDMVRLQRIVGMRPTELCELRAVDIDRSGDVWWYTVRNHKTAHRGHVRRIPIGPAAQQVLAPYLENRSPFVPCFSPLESRRRRFAAMRKARRSSVQPSQVDRSRRNPARRPGDVYTKNSYAQAVRRACEKAGVSTWRPNQLRHSVGTRVRATHGLEAAQLILGHRRANVSEIYAERDWGKAEQIAKAIG